MNFKQYQKEATKTALYPRDIILEGEQSKLMSWIYPMIGLSGEAGEVANKVKKIIRDEHGEISSDMRNIISMELGDLLWYMAQLCTELHISLDDVAFRNIEKLKERAKEGKIKGSGDKR